LHGPLFAGRNLLRRQATARCSTDRFVNEFLIPLYGPEASKKPYDVRISEMELALVEL